MTTYIRHDEEAAVRGRYAAIKSPDPAFAEDFVGDALAYLTMKGYIPRVRAQQMGMMTVLLAAAALEALGIDPLRDDHTITDDEKAVLAKLFVGKSLKRARRAVTFLASMAKEVTGPLAPYEKHQCELWQFGYDGHSFTRETAQKLRLMRRFERAGEDFHGLIHKAWLMVVGHGKALTAWSRRMPLLLCDLARPHHLSCAIAANEIARGELVVVTKTMTPAVQRAFAVTGPMVVHDPEGLMSALTGAQKAAVLLERRMEGWTLTYGSGVPDKHAVKDHRIPLFYRMLSRTAYEADDALKVSRTDKAAKSADGKPEPMAAVPLQNQRAGECAA